MAIKRREGTCMASLDERLTFIVRFANMELERLRPGDWLNLQDDLSVFIFGRAGEVRPITPDTVQLGGPVGTLFPLNSSMDLIRALQAETRQVLEWLTRWRTEGAASLEHMIAEIMRGWTQGAFPTLLGVIDIHVQLSLIPLDSVGGRGRTILAVAGPTRDVYLYTLYQLLSQDEAQRIMQCPECGTIFVRVRKQRYCSRRCTNRVNMRDWRHTEKGKAGESGRNHARYTARVQRGKGAKVKIGRRPHAMKPTKGA
jgi:hypothetical protein